MKRLVPLLLAAATGCAPLYYPSPVNVSMLEQAGDVHGMASAGYGGFQGDLAYGVTDRVAVQGQAQVVPRTGEGSGRPYYSQLSLGVGPYWAPPGIGSGGWRGGLTLQGGVSWANTASREGNGLRTAVQLDGGYEGRYAALGLAVRPVSYRFTYDDSPDQRLKHAFAEAAVLGRAGGERIKVEAQLGMSLPVVDEGDIGVPLPFMFSLGLVVDDNVFDWRER